MADGGKAAGVGREETEGLGGGRSVNLSLKLNFGSFQTD